MHQIIAKGQVGVFMSTRRKITIKDVASDAGVSVGTVSRVLAKTAEVKQPLKDRVNQSIIKLGYKPNLAARALRANRVNVIGLMVPNITNPFFAQIAEILESEVSKRGFALILTSSHGDMTQETRQFSALLDHAPAGIVLIPSSDEIAIQPPEDLRLAILDRPLPGMSAIALDQQRSSALAADYLFELGHRKIAYIAGPRNIKAAIERVVGFSSRIEELKKRDPSIELDIHQGQFDYASGEEIARTILSLPDKERPTAIAAASDQQAIGVLRAARDVGIKVPDDLSVVGFDDIDLADLFVPRLTTIRQPLQEMVFEALNQILNTDKEMGDKRYMAKLIARRSTSTPHTSR